MKTIGIFLMLVALLLINLRAEGSQKQPPPNTARGTDRLVETGSGTIKFANGETRRFRAISGMRDCTRDKYEIHPSKLVLDLFPSPNTPSYVLIPLDKVTNIKFTKIYRQYDEGRSGSTGTAVEVLAAQGKKETFESRHFSIQIELVDSMGSAQYFDYQLWGAEISLDQSVRTNR